MALLDGDRQRRHRDRGFALEMELDHLLDVHPVNVVGAKHGDQVGRVVLEQVEVLKNRVRGSLVPVLTHPHLGRHGNDKVIGQHPAEVPTRL